MAAVNPPPGALVVENHNGSDPFVTGAHDAHRQRYAAFDNTQFSLYLTGSPVQAKRALRAHLAETTRRLQETSHLGNALVQQRKELEDKLKEVEEQQQDNDIGPELRQRLAELEKEFNEVGRETARAFLPKSRVPSGETDTAAGGSVYFTEGQHSPTKVSVPSRKQRNQQPTRINDIALATEISTSLLSQLKDLQAVLLERDEALKAADLDRSQLEIEVEGLSQRLRTLDESESRLKDVNWNLETQVRESEAQSKSAADREQRLHNVLNSSRSEKLALERELEELKQLHSKLNDDHINKTKQHETELSSLRRNVTMGESERGALQRKLEELTTQNSDLAKAVAYRMKNEDYAQAEDTSPSDAGEERDVQTPEHSPPPSPSKATPRHGMLESETLKHSLQHAHRMIQQLKNNIHREKTEKIELKRMLQDARDEIDTSRSANGPGSATKRRKSDKDIFKKPVRPDRLGAFRSGTQEITVEDEDWEEHDAVANTPSRKPAPAVPGGFESGFSSAAEGFETANETSDAAFETANERDGMSTESDAFQTGAETLDGDSSDQLTETEAGPTPSTVRNGRSMVSKGSYHDSYESTASASDDDFNSSELRTPNNQHSRFRQKPRQGSNRMSTPRQVLDLIANTPPAAKDSPASFAGSSRDNTPAQKKSLFAELNDLSGEEGDSSFAEDTPSRSSVVSPDSSPDASRKSVLGRSPLQASVLPKPMMVDSSTMTEREAPKPVTMSSVSFQHTEPMAVPLAALNLSALHTQDTSPRIVSPPSLQFSSFSSQGTVPKAALPPTLQISNVLGSNTIPKAVLPPSLQISNVLGSHTIPQHPPAPLLAMSSLAHQATTPERPAPPMFKLSSMTSQDTQPRAVPTVPLNVSSISTHHAIEPRKAVPAPLALSSFSSHGTEPVAPVVQKIVAPSLGVSTIAHQKTEPREGSVLKALAVAAPAALLASAIATQSTKPEEPSVDAASDPTSRQLPVDETVPTPHQEQSNGASKRPSLQMSQLSAHETLPKAVARQMPSAFSTMSSHATEPFAPKPVAHQISLFSHHSTEPLAPKRAAHQLSSLSHHSTEPLAPKSVAHQLSSLSHHSTEPLAPQLPQLQMSSFSSRSTEPVEVPKPAPWQLSSLTYQSSQPVEPRRPAMPVFSTVSSQATEPVALPVPAPSKLSMLSSQATEPLHPQPRVPEVSTITAQHIEPIALPKIAPIPLAVSGVTTFHETQPHSPTLPAFPPTPTSRPSTANRVPAPVLAFSTVTSQHTEPLLPSRPVTAHRDVPPPFMASTTSAQTEDEDRPLTASKPGYFDSLLSWGKQTELEPASEVTRGIRQPLAPIEANTVSKATRASTSDGGTQTMVSADQIDKLLLIRSQQRHSGTIANAVVEKALSPPHSPARRNSNEMGRTPRRTGSSGSMRSRNASPPPLPPDHKEVIAAAALKPVPSSSTLGVMGPPTMPASAYKKRPQTPSIKSVNAVPAVKNSGTTTRSRRQSHRSEARSGAPSIMSRRSSLSSFTSEIDHRFNIPGGPSWQPAGMPAGGTDPRMIQAITQTMIGEFLWKYTRKTGRTGMSENRHRRFFWIHPYTRTLYWSDRDPQSAGKSELKAKSVAIESVQEVDDNNPLPPGLHQKSLLVTTPGRSIKFTATTSQRHETWYNALNYLCQRVEVGDEPSLQEEKKDAATDEIQDEFNAGYRSASRQTARSRASASSYVTRRASSPHHAEIPTLRHSASAQQHPAPPERSQSSVSSRFSSILRPTSAMRGSYSSRYSKTSQQESPTYEEPNDTNMELGREIHDHVERDIDGMMNVRACCDGESLQYLFCIRANFAQANMMSVISTTTKL